MKTEKKRDGKEKGGKGAPKINISNRKASHEFKFEQEFTAGIKLFGSEVKSIASGNASIADAYAYLNKGEIFVKNMYVAEFDGKPEAHVPNRERKLLLKRTEINKIENELKDKGTTLVVTKIYNKKGLIKVTLQLSRGKKNYDKRNDLREKDAKREMDRAMSKND